MVVEGKEVKMFHYLLLQHLRKCEMKVRRKLLKVKVIKAEKIETVQANLVMVMISMCLSAQMNENKRKGKRVRERVMTMMMLMLLVKMEERVVRRKVDGKVVDYEVISRFRSNRKSFR